MLASIWILQANRRQCKIALWSTSARIRFKSVVSRASTEDCRSNFGTEEKETAQVISMLTILPPLFRLSVFRLTNGLRELVVNMSNNRPDFSVAGLRPGTPYEAEVAGYNVKGVGVPASENVYTHKAPQELVPSMDQNPRKHETEFELDGQDVAIDILSD